MEKNLKPAGVYKIYNKTNGRIYIGSSGNIINRFKTHLSYLKNKKHHNKFLQADFNKCGEIAFEFEIIEIIEGNKKNII